jgi:hypothetical protein
MEEPTLKILRANERKFEAFLNSPRRGFFDGRGFCVIRRITSELFGYGRRICG